MSSKNFTIRVPDELRKELETIAEKEHRSLSNLIQKFLIEGVENYSKNEKMK